MSDTIQVRAYSAAQASMCQLRPSAVIDTAERFHQQALHHLPVLPTRFYGCGADVHIIATEAVGSAVTKTVATAGVTRILRVDTDQVTSAAVAKGKGHIANLWSQWAETTQTALQKQGQESKPTPSPAARLRVERLVALQASLGLSTSDLAHSLGRSRPILYKWLDAASDVQLQGASRDRLAAVERIATQWRNLSTAPLSSVSHEPLADGRTVLEMMTAGQIDETAVVGAFKELLAKLAGKPKSRSQKLADAGFKRRPSARSLPSDE